MTDFTDAFRQTIERSYETLAQLTDEQVRRRPAPDKWSPIEILGHLVDSATNNHRRFILAHAQDHLRFDGYAQDDWVRLHDYQHADWAELLSLWRFYNLHLARLMAITPADLRLRTTTDHEFDRMAMRTVPAGTPSSLDYLMRDYVYHLEHHVRQIEGLVNGD